MKKEGLFGLLRPCIRLETSFWRSCQESTVFVKELGREGLEVLERSVSMHQRHCQCAGNSCGQKVFTDAKTNSTEILRVDSLDFFETFGRPTFWVMGWKQC